MSGSSAAVAAQPSIERLDVVVAPSLSRFFFGLRDRIADATLFEFGSAHRDLEIDRCRDPLPVSHWTAHFLVTLHISLEQPRNPLRVRTIPATVRRRHFRRRQPTALHDLPPRFNLIGGLTGLLLAAATMVAPTFSVAARSGSRNRCA